jgi:anaphase-promoting complex subunit 10
MPYDSDESGSEPDLSILAMARGRHAMADQARVLDTTMTYDEEEILSQEQYDAEDTSVEEQADQDADADRHEEVEEGEEEEEDEEDEQEEMVALVDPATIGLKEISNLGRFTVSSHKPGNGVEELRSDDLKQYWQYVYILLA